jgi:predicted O-methyltransferase YrrM
MDTMTGLQPPLAPLYQPNERFEISAAGLDDWQRSESFKRTTVFYLSYPARSLLSHASRAVLHHLIVMRRPRLALEIGTYQAGTSEVMARALWEAGQGHLETIDPYGAERCPPIIAALPPELQQRISFSPVTSALHFDQAMSRGALYDLVFIDGNHEFEFARFDLECAARLMRPGGIIVLDNVSQSGPRLATKLFLESNPDWRDIADVVRWINPDDPMASPIPSVGRTDFYLIEAPPHHAVGDVPRSFGNVACDRAEVDGIDLDLAAPARGTLHLQVYARTFGMQEPEELQAQQHFALDRAAGPVRLPLDRPLRTAVHAEGLPRRVEIVLAFTGDGGLALRSPPMPYPARHI